MVGNVSKTLYCESRGILSRVGSVNNKCSAIDATRNSCIDCPCARTVQSFYPKAAKPQTQDNVTDGAEPKLGTVIQLEKRSYTGQVCLVTDEQLP